MTKRKTAREIVEIVKSEPLDNVAAFGEQFGIALPTRYPSETFAALNTLLAVDALATPWLFGMSRGTVWFCRILAGLLLLLRGDNHDLSLRNALQLQALIGLALISLSLRGGISGRFFERIYLLSGGMMMLANTLMTQVEERHA